MIELRPYQSDAIEALRANIRRGIRNQILSAATGAGKTVCAAYLLKECHDKGKRAVFVADRIALINQTCDTLDRYGVPCGVQQADHWRTKPWERIQVASAQTLARRKWPDADLTIVDECHGLNKTVLDRISPRDTITIGLTATPFTKGLGKFYDAVVTVRTTDELTADGYLVPFRVFAASEPDMTGAKTVAGEWTDDVAAERSMPIVGDCVAEYMKHGENRKFLAFGCTVAHCAELQRQFIAAGIVTELYTYKTPDEARAQMIDEFRKPDSYIRGLVSVAALAKGFDVSDVGCIIMARPLKSSLAEHIQILGRGLRPHEGKTECLVLDHAGNMARFWRPMHDFFAEGAHELDDGKMREKKKKEAKEPEPIKCPKCAHMHKPRPSCPACGFVYQTSCPFDHVPGELKELGEQRSLFDRDMKQAWWSMLLQYARDHEYKDGWASHKYREKFSVWPKGLSDVLHEPTPEVMRWIRSRNIAWAKRRAA